MTPEEIELQIQAVQELIELVRSETQKGGNTKERVANLLTKINQIVAELNERPSGGGDLTLEQARENGNVLEGDIEIEDTNVNFSTISFFRKGNGSNLTGFRWYDDNTLFLGNIENSAGSGGLITLGTAMTLSNKEENNDNVSLTFNASDLLLSADRNDFKGISGDREFDKQGDRKAFAQMSDVYDNMGGDGSDDYVSKVSEDTQEMNASLKTGSVILGANIGTPIAWQFGRKDGVVGYADASGVWRPVNNKTVFEYTPTGNFNLSTIKTLVDAEGMQFNDCDILIQLGSNNYNCTIDIGTTTTNRNIALCVRRRGAGSIQFASNRTLLATDSLFILAGNEGSSARIDIGTSTDILTIANL